MKSAIHWQDDEDQAYLMDEAGNIEPSQTSSQTPQGTACPVEHSADVWGDRWDDQDYLEGLEDFEQNSQEIPDQLLLTCVTDLDSK